MKSRNTFGIHFVLGIPTQQKNGMATVYAKIAVNGRRFESRLKRK